MGGWRNSCKCRFVTIDPGRPRADIPTDRYFTVLPETRVEYQLAVARNLAASALYAIDLFVIEDMLLRVLIWAMELVVLFFGSGLVVRAAERGKKHLVLPLMDRYFAVDQRWAGRAHMITGGFMLGFAGSSNADAFPLTATAWAFHLVSGCLIAVVLGALYIPSTEDR